MMFYFLSFIMFLFISVLMLMLSIIFFFINLNMMIEWNFLNLNSSMMNMMIFIDWISLIFIFTVLLISSMIMIYSSEYMNHDKFKIRFYYLMLLFILSMILMILSPNLISIILGWDGLGLISYCLIIYYQNNSSNNSGMLTILMNRVGDIMLMMSISFMFIFGSWNFLNLLVMNYFILYFILISGMTKSAQFPFSSWLPAAMAAPTPVSSLVHSSTLVTAGIYLLIRFKNLMYLNNLLLMIILFVGTITMFLAGISAINEFDFKKIIAYSTLSQLGMMLMIYSMKFYLISFFHLIIHAMFKSMMFMCSGIIIHYLINYQDIRMMGNMIEFLPLTYISLMISNFSLCGMPFFSGFFSKDLILEFMFLSKFSMMIYFILIVNISLTLIYSIRLLIYLNLNNFNFLNMSKIYDNKIMNFSMLILIFNSLILGYILNWLMFMNIEEIYLFKWEKNLILLLCMILIMIYMNIFKKLKYKNLFMNYFMGKMLFMYKFNNLMVKICLMIMNKYYMLMDKNLMNYMFENYFKYNLIYLNFKFYKMNNLINLMMFTSFILMFIYMI